MKNWLWLASVCAFGQMIDYNVQLKNQPQVPSAKYNFRRQTFTASITAGARTFTMSPCPVGVSGSNFSASHAISGAANNGSGAIRITSAGNWIWDNHRVTISGVTGTTEANGNWNVVRISSTTFDLVGSTFTNAYVSGGTAYQNIHYLRIYGGVGTAEVAPIVGGTCTSGASSGTVILQVANSHSGTYYVGSATSGIQEAVRVVEAQANGGSVILPMGNTTIYGPVTVQGSPAVTIRGMGKWATNVVLDSTLFTTETAFGCRNPTCLFELHDFLIGGHASHSAGVAVQVQGSTSGRPLFKNVMAADTWGGFFVFDSDYVRILNCDYEQSANTNATFGVKVDGSSSDIQIIGGRFAAPEINVSTMLDYGILLTGGDGVAIVGVMVRANYGISLEPVFGTGSLLFGSIFITDGTIIDRCRTNGVRILSTGTPAGNDFFGEVYFSNSHIAGDVAMEGAAQVYIELTTMAGAYSGISFTGMKINNSKRNGVRLIDVNGVTISSSRIVNNNTEDVLAAAIYATNGKHISIIGNSLLDTTSPPKQRYGVFIDGTIDYLTMTGNMSVGNLTSPYNNGASLTNAVITGNTGSDDLIGAITAAATVSLPSNLAKTMAVSGTTTIDTINGAVGSGDTRTFFCPSGLTFSAAGNIKVAVTTTFANQVVRCVWNAGDSKWYCQ